MEGIVRVRVRGIYATALTKLFLDSGLQVVQPSRVIAERFNLLQLTVPPDVTVKDSSDPSELVVIGYPRQTRRVLEVLREKLPTSFYWVSGLQVHSTVLVELLGGESRGCKGRVGEVDVVVRDIDECEPGSKIIARVVKAPVKPIEAGIVVPGASVINDYVIMSTGKEGYGRKVTVSEHIRDPEKRAELLALAAKYTGEPGLSIHWRSSAQYADRSELENALRDAYEKLRDLLDTAKEGAGAGATVLSEGELVAVVRLSSVDKRVLDMLRREVVPTTPLHHTLKSVGGKRLQDIVDFADIVASKLGDRLELLEQSIIEYLASRLRDSKSVTLFHVKPTGEVITLGEARVKQVTVNSGRLEVVVERRVRSPGIYDGLGVEKEPGDTIVTTIRSWSWAIEHRYYDSDMNLKGVYVNINTPPELAPDAIYYLDLLIDVVKLPGRGLQVVDVEELIDYCRRGVLTDHLAEKALTTAAEITRDYSLLRALNDCRKPDETSTGGSAPETVLTSSTPRHI